MSKNYQFMPTARTCIPIKIDVAQRFITGSPIHIINKIAKDGLQSRLINYKHIDEVRKKNALKIKSWKCMIF